MSAFMKTVCRRCEHSEAIQPRSSNKDRSGLLHFVRNDGRLFFDLSLMRLPCSKLDHEKLFWIASSLALLATTPSLQIIFAGQRHECFYENILTSLRGERGKISEIVVSLSIWIASLRSQRRQIVLRSFFDAIALL